MRGLEAITSSFPPIPTVSILRRPGNQGIGSWGKVMNDLGYQSSFLYGGYGYFDDMNTFFAGNGFQVLDRTGGRGQVLPHEKGWKDTVLAMPGEKVRVIVAFGQEKGVFVFHCHNLEHEDSGMMLQMEIK